MSGPVVSVIGGAPCTEEEAAHAREVGERLARAGAILVCGGLGGVMEAACEGAAAAGGVTVGLLPGEDPAEANRHVTVPIATGLGHARNLLVASAGQAVIAVGGGAGTLSEIAFARVRGRPVIGLGSWRLDEGRLPGGGIPVAASPEEAVRLALEAAGG